ARLVVILAEVSLWGAVQMLLVFLRSLARRDGSASARPLSQNWRRRLGEKKSLLIGSFAAAAGSIWLLHRGALPVIPPGDSLKEVPLYVAPLYALLFVIVSTCRAYRVTFLLRSLGRYSLREVLSVSYVFFAALLILPVRLGELVRPALFARREVEANEEKREGVSGWQIAGVVAAERLVDGLCASCILLIALLSPRILPAEEMVELAPLVRPLAFSALAVFSAGFLLTSLFYLARERAQLWTRKALGIFSPRLAEFVARTLLSIAEGLQFLSKPRDALPFFAWTFAYWFLNAGTIAILLELCGIPGAGLVQAAAVLGVLSLGLMVPSAPGFFGTFQMSVYGGLALFLHPEVIETQGAVFVFLFYLVQVLTLLFLGGVGSLFLRTPQARS
ncbi:MAG: flippase-like domain-containing protein, partial [Polyangiaceae bacterium]|nr:flippase-like domain-containing protein [Polyangiaceae bacterium]